MSPAINCAKGAIGINNAYKRNQVGFGGPSIPPPFCGAKFVGSVFVGSVFVVDVFVVAVFVVAGAEGSGAEFRDPLAFVAGAEGSGAEFRGGAEAEPAIPVILLKEFIKASGFFHIP